MKSKKLIIIILVIIIISFVGIFIFKNRTIDIGIEGNDAKGVKLTGKEVIESIYYSYASTYIGGIYSYEIYKDNDDVKLKVIYMNINEDNPDVVSIDNSVLDKTMNLIKKHNVNKWNGYHKYATNVLDGDGFSLKFKFNDGKTIDFSGSNCAPDGYYSFEKEFFLLIEDDVKTIKAKYEL